MVVNANLNMFRSPDIGKRVAPTSRRTEQDRMRKSCKAISKGFSALSTGPYYRPVKTEERSGYHN